MRHYANRDKWVIPGGAAIVVLAIAIPLGLWVTSSYFEARAFERVTGKSVSTVDAMFIELRVQEPSQ